MVGVRYSDAEDHALAKFVIENQGKYESFKIFYEATLKVDELSGRTALSAYQRFTRYLATGDNPSEMNDSQLLSLAERCKVPINNVIGERLRGHYHLDLDEEGIVIGYRLRPEGLAEQLNQMSPGIPVEEKGPNQISNVIFQLISVLLGCLGGDEMEKLNNRFSAMIIPYFRDKFPRDITQNHFEHVVQTFSEVFSRPNPERAEMEVFQGNIIGFLMTIHRSLVENGRNPPDLAALIEKASGSDSREYNNFPDFNYPVQKIKKIIDGILTNLEKCPYSPAEDRALAKFVIENQGKYGSFKIFFNATLEMEELRINRRNAHSAYQRFIRYLAPGTKPSQLSNKEMLILAEKCKVKLDEAAVRKLEKYFVLNLNREGLIVGYKDRNSVKEFQEKREKRTIEGGNEPDKVVREDGDDSDNSDEEDEDQSDESGEEDKEQPDEIVEEVDDEPVVSYTVTSSILLSQATPVNPAKELVLVEYYPEDGDTPDESDEEDEEDEDEPDHPRDTLFRLISHLIVCLNEKGFVEFNNRFLQLIPQYFEDDSPRILTEDHLDHVVETLYEVFKSPAVNPKGETVELEGRILGFYMNIYLGAIMGIAPYLPEDMLPSFVYPVEKVKNIIFAILSNLEQ